MPTVKSPDLLKVVYEATLLIARDSPSTMPEPNSTVFRAFSDDYFVVDVNRPILRRDHADGALRVPPFTRDENRWTGLPHCAGVQASGGLYCSIQQQATVNEVAHYFEKARAVKANAA